MLGVVALQLLVELPVPLIDVVDLLVVDKHAPSGELASPLDLRFDLVCHSLSFLIITQPVEFDFLLLSILLKSGHTLGVGSVQAVFVESVPSKRLTFVLRISCLGPKTRLLGIQS